MLTYLSQLRHAVLSIARGVLRGAAALWRDVTGPWWTPYTLIPPPDRSGVVQRGEGLAEVTRRINQDDWRGTVADTIANVGGLVSDFGPALRDESLIWFSVTVEVSRPGADPWYMTHRFRGLASDTAESLQARLAGELEELTEKYNASSVVAASLITMLYGG